MVCDQYFLFDYVYRSSGQLPNGISFPYFFTLTGYLQRSIPAQAGMVDGE